MPYFKEFIGLVVLVIIFKVMNVPADKLFCIATMIALDEIPRAELLAQEACTTLRPFFHIAKLPSAKAV